MTQPTYDDDILIWSEEQAALLRRVAAGERVNNVDWENVIEEIESVGSEQLHAVEALLGQALRHMLKVRRGRFTATRPLGARTRSISGDRRPTASLRPCGSGSTWRASMLAHCARCRRRSTVSRRCRCRRPAR
jgi:Domain of unknown function DUF29